MNGYGYSDANPVNLYDPSGLYVVGGVDPNTGNPYGVRHDDHGGALVGFPENELNGARCSIRATASSTGCGAKREAEEITKLLVGYMTAAYQQLLATAGVR